MKISHYFEFSNTITGGISSSVKHQRKMMDNLGIEYTTKPDLDADILHLNFMGPRSIYYARKARKKGIPVIIHTHNTAEEWDGGSFLLTDWLAGPFKKYLSYAYSLGDLLICPSEYNKELVEDYTDTEKTVISNGFDMSKIEGFEAFRREYLDRYDLEPPVVFCTGHVLKRKGLKTFVETARKMPETDFVWFGYLQKNLKTRETRKIIESAPENCQFTGFIEDIRGAFAAGDIFFFPTKEENEGISLLEAMGAGKPVVIRDIETFEWLEDKKDCLKTDKDFVETIERLFDSDLRASLGKAAKGKSEEFQLENVQKQLEKAYKQVLSD